jgi:hypothetical protein
VSKRPGNPGAALKREDNRYSAKLRVASSSRQRQATEKLQRSVIRISQ